ncbi:MAG: hypothetical protein HC794_09785 [Nitrospiraceae bacterium]|nr:hypothetical protein [Nitrospiraceae bacterium]
MDLHAVAALENELVSREGEVSKACVAFFLKEDAFKPLRLQNGLYIQRHAPMLRIAIPYGLLGQPDMHVAGQGSTASTLRWFADQTESALPTGSAVSVPLWIYRIAMLAWALWLANAVVGWLRWALRAWMAGGYWRALRRPKAEGEAKKAEEPPPL